MSIVTKRHNQKHFTAHIADNADSDRIVLPTNDHCRVKVTRFKPPAGFVAENITYPWEETVYVVSGYIVVKTNTNGAMLTQGGVYVVPANTPYTLVVQTDSVLICVFSAVPGGPPVDDK